jgi:hypothetical protein
MTPWMRFNMRQMRFGHIQVRRNIWDFLVQRAQEVQAEVEAVAVRLIRHA